MQRYQHTTRQSAEAAVCRLTTARMSTRYEAASKAAHVLQLAQSLFVLCCLLSLVVCAVCHHRLLLAPRPQCPVCRLRLARDHPVRNRFAERVKDDLRVHCSHSQCTDMVRFSELQKHVKTQCGFRETKCSFLPLGCEWRGPVNGRLQHERRSQTTDTYTHTLGCEQYTCTLALVPLLETWGSNSLPDPFFCLFSRV